MAYRAGRSGDRAALVLCERAWSHLARLATCLFAALLLTGCASRQSREVVAGDHGSIVVEALQSGSYSEGNSAAWLQFLIKASYNGYAQDVVTAHYVLPKAEVLAGRNRLDHCDLCVLWIGHSTFLIRIGGLTILTDPVFSQTASPLEISGPRRYVPPALEIDELPRVDVILISHNHYDHLDDASLAKLGTRFPEAALLLPRGNEDHGRAAGFHGTLGIDVGESLTVAGVRLLALPAYHDTSRFGLDAYQTRALGYSLRAARGGSIYFAGDTGYGPVFKQIRRAYGAHDVALVPIGAYEPHKETRAVHVSPEEALQVATDIGAKLAIGMHWGTFPLSGEPVFEPARRFMRARRPGGVRPLALRIGGSMNLDAYRSGDRVSVAADPG